MPSAIEVNQLGKRYRLGVDASGYDTVREALRRALRRTPRNASEVWALRDLSLTVDEGEALGVIGDNGAGKTTLLKILAGITEPTRGEARTRGRVGALLDVGTGFHPELTGLENIYLSGAILGMRRADIRLRFDEIVDFAGVERFLDTPVKRYSEGMRLRLAFAVAAHIEPPIIVVDEVLAVGDAPFREKCLGKMAEISAHARTVVFVSHDLGSISRLCGRAIWLEEGRLRQEGPADELVSSYLRAGAGQPLVADFGAHSADPVALIRAAVWGAHGNVLSSARRDEPFAVDLRFVVREPVPGLDVAILLVDEAGVRVIDDAHSDRATEELCGDPGVYHVRVTIPPILTAGRYTVATWIGTELEDLVERDVLSMQVIPRDDDSRHSIERRRVVQPHLVWQVQSEPFDRE